MITSVLITARTSRPSSYARFKYPVKFHSSERRQSLTCDVPDCLRRPSSGIYWRMPVRQGPRRPTVRTQSPSGAGAKTELPSGTSAANNDQAASELSPVVVVEVENAESFKKETIEENLDTEEATVLVEVETPQDQADDGKQYESDHFEDNGDEGVKEQEIDSVTSNYSG